jgi:nickel/cobalt transporter (NicO) family protein
VKHRSVTSVTRRVTLLAVVVVAVLGGSTGVASAHPLGNFTVNRYTGVRLDSSGVAVDLVTDMAEIPTFQAKAEIDTDGDKTVSATEGATWASRQCGLLATQVSVQADGHPVAMRAATVGSLAFPAGQAGLETLRLECGVRSTSSLEVGDHELKLTDTSYTGRVGWHEVVAQAGNGASLLRSDVPGASITKRLTSYPKDVLRSPVEQRSASLRARVIATTVSPAVSAGTAAVTSAADAPGASAAGAGTGAGAGPASAAFTLPSGALPRGLDRATRTFTDLVSRKHLTLGFGLLAVLLAVVLGSFHALAPGHGKTVMAAYIVGQRGTVRQAALIGLTVTATHTAGVVVLGVVLTSTKAIAPERLYPWLGLASGLLLAGIGVTLFRRARRISRMPLTVPAAWEAELHSPVLVGATSTAVTSTAVASAAVTSTAVTSAAVTSTAITSPHGLPHDHDHGHDDHGHGHGHGHGHDHHDHGHDHGRSRGRHRATANVGRVVVAERQLLSQRRRAATGTDMHSHGGAMHSHPTFDPALGWRSLVGVGFAGGLVPSPSALLVLLGAIALGRTWFGLILVTAYGLGMAIMLTLAGLLLVRARSWFDRRAARSNTPPLLLRWGRYLPLCTSALIIVAGLTLAARELTKL